YNESAAPFTGGQADSLSWWKNLPLKAFAMTILSIVGHAGKVEWTLSNLSTTQSARCCNFSVETFETLGKIHANLHYHQAKRVEDNRKPACHWHLHLHTHEEVGINVDVAQDLEANFAWVPPLAAEPQDVDDLLAGPETISADEITEEFGALE
ncbi:uncharacterized protein BJ212DRAFT_1230899, partial [Suillus subaureus]